MRIAVTGVRGQLAMALAQQAPAGIEVLRIDRATLDLAADLDYRPVMTALKPDLVVNAGAYTAVDRAESEPELAFAINGAGAGRVATASAALGLPIIHLSTDYVFDGLKTTPYLEDDPTGPVSVYGRSKLEGERLVAAANPHHLILRTAWVFSHDGQNFFRTMLRLAETRDEISVVSDQIGCPTYAGDIADALFCIAPQILASPDNAENYGVFHLCNRGETSWAGFAAAIFAASKARGGPFAEVIPIPSRDYPTSAARPANSRLGGARLQARYGIEMPRWEDALDRCLEKWLPAP